MRSLPSILGLVLAASVFAVPAPASAASDSSIYWGAYLNGAPFDSSIMDKYESTTGKKMSIVTWGEPWVQNGQFMQFQTATFQSVRGRGSLPLLTWGSWELGKGATQPAFQLDDISNGTYDSFIRQWAQDAKAWGQPFFLRFDHEMNGWWYPWNEQTNGNGAGDYVRMWRHVHDIFTQVGASNVTWVWCPNIVSPRSTPTASMYPGSSYVDWTCMDGYNWGTDYNNAWQTFTQVVSGSPSYGGHNTYQELLSVGPDKPIMLGEIASSEHGGSKSGWIDDMLTTQLPAKFPSIKAVIWNEWAQDPATSWPIESSASATNAFASGIRTSTYATNSFSGISGKIGALQAAAPPPPAQPPLQAQGAGSVTLNPIADTYTSRSDPTSTGGGNSTGLRADLTGTDTTFMRFDLSSLAGRSLTSATLRVHTNSISWAGSLATFNVLAVSADDWKEQYMSYVNSIPVSSTLLGSLTGTSTPSTWYSTGLTTSTVQKSAGDLFSLAITARTGDVLIVDSRESGTGTAPQLVLTYN
jgi:hypothetical protein